ncbi:MAG: LamG-like jellyroll fold domain-containing protein [Victivallales bacterium]
METIKFLPGRFENTEKRIFFIILKYIPVILLSVILPFNVFAAEKQLLADWPLDEGAGEKAIDKSGNRNGGKIVNARWIKNRLYFNGNDSYVQIPSGNIKSGDKITIEASIKLEKKGGNTADWRKNNQLIIGRSGVFELLVSAGDRLVLNLWTDAGLKTTTLYGYSVCGKWQQVAFSYDGENIILYVNGKAKARNELRGHLCRNQKPFCIGAAARGKYCMFAKGIISEVKIYNGTGSGPQTESFVKIDTYNSLWAKKLQQACDKLGKLNQARTLNMAYGAPRLDGLLNDPCWQKAQKMKNFFIAGSMPPAFAEEKTEVRACYDKKNLYLGIVCRESSPAKIKAEVKERDSTIWLDDCVEIFIGKKPLKSYYHFFANSLGTKSDIKTEYLGQGRAGSRYRNDKKWNPEWQVAAGRNADSWIAEIAIPWSSLPGITASGNTYINICREEKPHGENSSLGYLNSAHFNDPKGFVRLSAAAPQVAAEKQFMELQKDISILVEKNKKFYAALKEHPYSFPYAFDFGTASSPLKNGFVRVAQDSLYQGQGYGFKTGTALSGHANKINAYGPDKLSCDFIEGKTDNEFIVDLPSGDYMLYLLAGDRKVPPPFSIYVNGEKRMTAADGANIYRLRHFSFRVENGKVNIALKGENGWLLNGLIIYPRAKDSVFIKEIEKLEEDIYLGAHPEYIAGFTRYGYLDKKPFPPIDEKSRKRGFIMVPADPLNIIYEKSIPASGKKFPGRIDMFAAQGEYEEIAFSVLPLEKLAGFKIDYTDFMGKNGRIAKSAVQLKEVKHYYHNFGGFIPARYMKFPKILENYSPHDLYTGKNCTFRLMVKVPAAAKPGNYYSTVTLGHGTESTDFKVNLTVYPFTLDPCRDYTFAMCYHLPAKNPARGIDGWNTLLLELKDMKEHNMNSVNFRPIVQNQWPELGVRSKSICVNGFAKLFRYAKQAGLTNDVPLCIELYLPYYLEKTKINFKENEWKYLKDALLELHAICRKEKLPGFYFYLDEPWMPERVYNYKNIFGYLKKAGLKNFCTVGQKPVYFPVFPFLDVRCYGNREGKLAEILKQTAETNSQFWVYNGPTWSYIPGKSRFTIGYKTWWEGAKGHMVWDYAIFRGGAMPLNPLSNPRGVQSHEILPNLRAPLSSTTWEAIREGIDDIKYIHTLEKLIASSTNNAVKTEAKKFLAELKADIGKVADKPWSNFADGRPLPDAEAPLSADYFNSTRRKIAEYIIKLRNVK